MAQASATSGHLLTSAPVSCTLTTTNLKRCREFYEKHLGLPCTESDERGLEFAAGGDTRLYIYLRDEPPRATNTVCAFKVSDVEGTINALREHGVTFEDYDLPGLKTENGIARDGDWVSAWCKDPDGNIIAIGNR